MKFHLQMDKIIRIIRNKKKLERMTSTVNILGLRKLIEVSKMQGNQHPW